MCPFRPIEADVMEVFLSLSQVLEGSTSHTSANSSELEEVKRRLAQAEQESLGLRQEVETARAVDQRVADLQAELDKDRTEDDQLKTLAKKNVELLTKKQETREATQARVAKVEAYLSNCVTERDTLKAANGPPRRRMPPRSSSSAKIARLWPPKLLRRRRNCSMLWKLFPINHIFCSVSCVDDPSPS